MKNVFNIYFLHNKPILVGIRDVFQKHLTKTDHKLLKDSVLHLLFSSLSAVGNKKVIAYGEIVLNTQLNGLHGF